MANSGVSMRTLGLQLSQMQNPFEDNADVDLPSIHTHLRAELRAAAQATQADHRRARPQIVFLSGESGEGKSHLLRRHQESGALCVSALEETQTIHRAVMAALAKTGQLLPLVSNLLLLQVRDLLHTVEHFPQGWSESGPVCSPALIGTLRKLVQEKDPSKTWFLDRVAPLWAEIEPTLRTYLLDLPNEGEIELAARKVLLQIPFPENRNHALAWLSGEAVSSYALEALGVSKDLRTEDGALRMLRTVLRTSSIPIQLIYDLVGKSKNVDGELVSSWFDRLVDLHTNCTAVVQIVSGEAEELRGVSEKLAKLLSPVEMKRIRRLTLSRLDAVQIRDLVALRLEHAFGTEIVRPSPIYPFLESEVGEAQRAAGISAVGAVLRHFAAEFTRKAEQAAQSRISRPPPRTTRTGLLEGAIARLSAESRRDLPGLQPAFRAGLLRSVFKDLSEGQRSSGRAISGVTVVGIEAILGGGYKISAQVEGSSQPLRIALEISNADPGPALFSVTSRLSRQVSDGKADLAILVREQSASSGPGLSAKAAQTFDSQLGRRGSILWLEEEDAIELLCLERLFQNAAEGAFVEGERVINKAEAILLVLSRDSGPPGALRRLFERVASLDEGGPQAVPERTPTGPTGPMPQGRTVSGRVTVGLGTVAAPPPADKEPETPPIKTTRPTQMGIGIVQVPRQTQTMAQVAPVTAQQVLQALRERPRIEEKQLAADLGVSLGVLSSLLTPLVQQGLLQITQEAGGRVVWRASQATSQHRIITGRDY